MKRRTFIGTVGLGGTLAGLSACNKNQQENTISDKNTGKTYKWRMVTTWPKDFPGLGTGAQHLAHLITKMSGNRIQIKVYAAGELVPPFEIFDTVSNGSAEIGHGAAYYWKGKIAPAQFFSAVPFGLTAEEINGWMYYGGALELWQELYEPFNLIPLPAGNTGVQMAGWFNKEINSLDDLKGLKMRIPGLGGEVLRRIGGIPTNLPGGELFTSLQTGVIDATEWVGPYNDLAFGFHRVAKHYYYPGWHEPGTTLEAIINKKAFMELPEDLQEIVLQACRVANQEILSEYAARNNAALNELIHEHKVDVRALPQDVLVELKKISQQVVEEIAEKDAVSRKIYEAYQKYRDQVVTWQNISTRAYLNARADS